MGHDRRSFIAVASDRGFDATAARAFELFERDARRSYGDDILKIVLFGSRARDDARPESDVDVAVVLKDIRDRAAERDRLADIAYDAIVETYVEVQAVRSPETNGSIRIFTAILH